jgi:nickel-dependent lactate racemase
MLYYERGSPRDDLGIEDLRAGLSAVLERLGPRRRVLAVPPDYTRVHSRAGDLARLAWERLGGALTDVLPALGTHSPMTSAQIRDMFGGVPEALFRVHDWRRGVATLGEVPADFVKETTGGVVDFAWPAQVARLIAEGGHDLVLSLGQVVPHEVMGMANYNKNIFVGTGGAEGINKSHFIGAAYGMERMMGRADTPVRRILEYASQHFARHLPIVYVHTVVRRAEEGRLAVCGLYAGDDAECFRRAAARSLRVTFERVTAPLRRVVVYLDPAEYKSTWLGNKSIYRTRMAIADGGELIVLAPGVREFGEDPEIDRLIRRHGYVGTPAVMAALARDPDLQRNLSAAAHLIHGSSEGRFAVTYCPGGLTREETEGAGFRYAEPGAMLRRYDPARLRDGWNALPGGDEVFYISNPALGLWASSDRFEAGA